MTNQYGKKALLAYFSILLLMSGCKDAVQESPDGVDNSENAISVQNEANRIEEKALIPEPPSSPEEFVRVRDYIPDIKVDLRYATSNNFTGSVIYDYTDAWLRYGTVQKLSAVQELLKPQGYGICIWDAFRSAAAQDQLWEAYPDGNYVMNPANGYSGHTRGDTVDITLVSTNGGPVDMPSGFDDFTAAADRDYSDVTPAQAEAAELLEQAMEESGFSGYEKEWWHYSDNEKYPPELEFTPPADK